MSETVVEMESGAAAEPVGGSRVGPVRNAIVRAEDVGVTLAGRPVLDGVELHLAPASIYVLLGENGAGKTTLMRTLCGRIAPSRGRVTVAGRDPRTDMRARRKIGFVPQSIALYPELSARENLSAFAAYAGRGRAAAGSVTTVLRELRLDHMAERRVGELSGGYQRRVNLGAALVTSPAFLLLDEPTVGLDADVKAILVDVVRATARRGTAVMLVTHDLDVATALVDRLGFLANGRITADGALADLLAQTFEDRVCLAFRPVSAVTADTAQRFARAGLRLSSLDETWRSPSRGVGPDAVHAVNEASPSDRSGTRHLEIWRPGLSQLYDALVEKERS